MKESKKGRRANHVIVIAGASGSGKTHLIKKLSLPTYDAFTLEVLKKLDCDPKQHFKRSTVERMQRLMDPANFKKRKTRRLKNNCLLLHIDLTSINHNINLKLLRKIAKRTKRLDLITLYISPTEWRRRIFDRLHTDDEPSMRAALIALSAKVNIRFSGFLYHREYTKWLAETTNLEASNRCIVNTFEQSFLNSIPPQRETKPIGERA